MVTFSIKEKILKSSLYIVPTPIGNLGDITKRALFVLKNVDIIAAESIQNTQIILNTFCIKKKLFSLNINNEEKKSSTLINFLKNKNSIGLVCNAGTPVINDPGYFLIKLCIKNNIRIISLPGACAAITALVSSGISSNRFCYEGFLPRKQNLRISRLQELKYESRTLIFYESKHRLLKSIENIISVFGKKRYIVLVKEISKVYEYIQRESLYNLYLDVKNNPNKYRGEIVLIIKGYKKKKKINFKLKKLMLILLENQLSIKTISGIFKNIFDLNKKSVYKYLLKNKAD